MMMKINNENPVDAVLLPSDRIAESYWHHLKTSFFLLIMMFEPSSAAPCPPNFSGFIPLESCSSYMYCWNGEFYYEISCPDGLKYDEKLGYCHPEKFVACAPEPLASDVFPDTDSFADILSDAACPDFHHGRVGINNCTGYVDCVNGFEKERAMCSEGQLYDIKSDRCEDSSIVLECNGMEITTLSSQPSTTIPPPATESFTTMTTTTGAGASMSTSGTATPESFPDVPSVYFPDWQKKICVKKDEVNIGFGDWYSYYDSIYHCCARNYLNSLNDFKNCLDFDIEILELPSSSMLRHNHNQYSFYPDWLNRKCIQEDPPHWVHSILKTKKYECCFEFFAWDFINCVSAN